MRLRTEQESFLRGLFLNVNGKSPRCPMCRSDGVYGVVSYNFQFPVSVSYSSRVAQATSARWIPVSTLVHYRSNGEIGIGAEGGGEGGVCMREIHTISAAPGRMTGYISAFYSLRVEHERLEISLGVRTDGSCSCECELRMCRTGNN